MRGGQAGPSPPRTSSLPPLLCPQSLAALPGLAAFPHFYQALSRLILLLLSLTALPLLSLLQSKFFTLSLFSSLSLALLFFLIFKNTFCLLCFSLAFLPFVCRVLFFPCHVCASRGPLSAHTLLPHISASLLPCSIPSCSVHGKQHSGTEERRGRSSGMTSFSPFSLSFSLFPYPPALSPLFPPRPSSLPTCSPALPSRFAIRLCSAIPATRFLQDMTEEEGFEVRGSTPWRRWLGEQPYSPSPWPCHRYTQLLQGKMGLLLSSLFSGSVSTCL